MLGGDETLCSQINVPLHSSRLPEVVYASPCPRAFARLCPVLGSLPSVRFLTSFASQFATPGGSSRTSGLSHHPWLHSLP